MILTEENIKIGLMIQNIDHPDWGIFMVDRDQNGWLSVANRGQPFGRSMLWENEFKFWEII